VLVRSRVGIEQVARANRVDGSKATFEVKSI
jgi:hypothetical protein